MKTILKRFEALAINSKADNFKGAVIRLTAYYTLGMLIVVIAFSTVVFSLFSADIESSFEGYPEDSVHLTELGEESVFHEITENLLDTILISDLSILVLTMIVSYFLARKTLAPLGVAYQKQKRFVADAAHELRTPLAVIKAGSEVLLKNGRTTEEYKKFVEESEEEVERLIVLSNDLLFLTQNSEVKEYAPETFSLSLICTKQCENVTAYATTKNIRIQTHVDVDVWMMGKKDDMSRLVLNLLKNAIDYNIIGGIVTLSLKRKQSQVVLSVADTGIGIPKHDIPHIFERFFKSDTSRVQKDTTGSGLGLSIVFEILSRHNGTVHVESTPNKGTTFTLKFPCV